MPELLKNSILILWVILTLYWYYNYIKDILKWQTRPHVFTWVIWWTLSLIAFAIQLYDNAGIWSVITWITWVVCIIISLLALKNWEKDITKSDKIFFSGAIVAILVWILLDNPYISVILITLISILGFIPTVRKSWNKPGQETISQYILASVKFILAIIILDNFSFLTLTFPLYLVIANAAFVLMILMRKRIICEK